MNELLLISDIKRNPATQPRTKMDMATVEEYSESLKGGSKFPPLVVFKVNDEYILVDGYHRHWAAHSAGIKKYYCEVHEGTMRDAILFASGVNATHGLRRTNEDKRRAVERLLVDDEWGKWSDNKIAEICNVSHPFVGKLRGNSCNVTRDLETEPTKTRLFATKKGTVSKINTENIGKKQDPSKCFSPQAGTIPVTDTPIQPSLLEQMAPNPSNSTGLEGPPKPRPAPCLSGQPCPDGKEHKTVLPNGKIPKCLLFNQYINQLIRDECYLDLKARKEQKDPAFLKASEYDPITGGKLIKGEPYKIVPVPVTKEQFIEACRGYWTKKTKDAADELVAIGQLGDDYAELIEALIWDAKGRMPA